MILEGLLTTVDADGQVNLAPMGPIVDARFERFILRPFRSSTTYRNLAASREGVFHVTDDACLIARAAIGRIESPPAMRKLPTLEGYRLVDACRWYALRAESVDNAQERTRFECVVVDRGWIRDFVGFNRARHALIEAAILATRVDLLPGELIRSQLEMLGPLVVKTGDAEELEAWRMLKAYIQERTA